MTDSTTVTLHINATEAVDLVCNLRKQGFVQGKDFDFLYRPGKQDWLGGVEESQCTEFIFYNQAIATFFKLKWV